MVPSLGLEQKELVGTWSWCCKKHTKEPKVLLTMQLSAGTVPASYLLRHLFPVYTCTSNGPLEKSLIFLCSVLFVVFPCSPFPFGDDMDGKWLIVATGDNNNCITKSVSPNTPRPFNL
ncbi:hypothetical protein EK904_008477 [Melospiza melodia maxima]|nr:hypothetical protein EK904_008477 [Melospiza melodia maxima]